MVPISCVENRDEVRSGSIFLEIGFDFPRTSKKDDQQSEGNSEENSVDDGDEFKFRVPTTHREFLLDYRELQRFPPEKFVKEMTELFDIGLDIF